MLPRRLSYSNLTLLVSIHRCSNRGINADLGCEPGQPITIRGYLFPLPSTPTVSIASGSLNATCESTVLVDSTTITCVPPLLSTVGGE